eukprot:TRINITY_DN42069_c0_g1_i1.p1 TRINITY_DN42069_c0_g1~~TRINITY_DN42069_c0_g1_i1.p1  ORF type:complete len:179 (-),score=13.42 TRINITY_DN42069_c0_g1_i1:692-1150(-)
MVALQVESMTLPTESREVQGLDRATVLRLTQADYDTLSFADKQKAADLLMAVSKQSCPATPRLASRCVADIKSAVNQMSMLGIDLQISNKDPQSNPFGRIRVWGKPSEAKQALTSSGFRLDRKVDVGSELGSSVPQKQGRFIKKTELKESEL